MYLYRISFSVQKLGLPNPSGTDTYLICKIDLSRLARREVVLDPDTLCCCLLIGVARAEQESLMHCLSKVLEEENLFCLERVGLC